jgi:hypothetical protein
MEAQADLDFRDKVVVSRDSVTGPGQRLFIIDQIFSKVYDRFLMPDEAKAIKRAIKRTKPPENGEEAKPSYIRNDDYLIKITKPKDTPNPESFSVEFGNRAKLYFDLNDNTATGYYTVEANSSK